MNQSPLPTVAEYNFQDAIALCDDLMAEALKLIKLRSLSESGREHAVTVSNLAAMIQSHLKTAVNISEDRRLSRNEKERTGDHPRQR